MKTVHELLVAKGHGALAVAPDASVYDALKLMADKNVGAVLVMDGSNLVGILSERDYARKIILQGKSSKTTPVREIMTEQVTYARPDNSVEDCMVKMSSKRIRHLPVLDDSRLVGMISIEDVLTAIVTNQKQTFDQLTQLSHVW
jgi:CBS domain-containing protein